MADKIPIKINKKPDVSVLQVEQFLNENWKFNGKITVKELVSYDSRTYFVESQSINFCEKFIFKISNSNQSRDIRYFECISLILHHLEINNFAAQKLIRSTNGKFTLDFHENPNQSNTDIRPLKSCLLSYIEGELVFNKPIDKDLCFQTAKELNKMTKCVDQISSDLYYLEEFTSESIWNIKNGSFIRHFIPYFDDEHKQSLLKFALACFDEKILPNINKLTKGFIHGDPNDMNILITNDKNISFIDWQDCTISLKVYDLSVLIFSLMSVSIGTPGSLDLYSIGKYCLMGYLSDDKSSLNSIDIDLLPMIVQTRIAISLSIGYYTHKYIDSTNQYILHTQRSGWKLLDDLMHNQEEYKQKWKP